MTKKMFRQDHFELFEYHGSTTVERVRKQYGKTIRRDWIIFDSVEEAQDFFNSDCEL